MLPQACILHYTTTYLQLPKMSLPELLPMAFNYDNNTAKFTPTITYSEQFAVDDYHTAVLELNQWNRHSKSLCSRWRKVMPSASKHYKDSRTSCNKAFKLHNRKKEKEATSTL
jgi:hypothetical protein